VTVFGEADDKAAAVGRIDLSFEISGVLQLGYQPGDGGLSDLFPARQFADSHRPVALDRRQRRHLRHRQTDLRALAHPAGDQQADVLEGRNILGVDDGGR
jgi:hypothetical protein